MILNVLLVVSLVFAQIPNGQGAAIDHGRLLASNDVKLARRSNETPMDCECGQCIDPCYIVFFGIIGLPVCAIINPSGYICCACCFPAEARVSLENGRSATMSELKVGDKVMTVSSEGVIKYTGVTTFLQKQHDVTGLYMSLATEQNKTIVLSDSHLIYSRIGNAEKFHARYVDEVMIGDKILVNENDKLNAVKVTNISSFVKQGAFVPLTSDRNIMVNGILASCYASFDHDVAHLAMVPMQLFPDLVEWIFSGKNGIHSYLSFMKSLGRSLMPQKYLYARSNFVKTG